nr:hypothetical protein [Tanacetum cinerariifolium]
MTLDIHNWSSSVHQEIYKIIKDEIFPIVNQVDAILQIFKIQFLKKAAKFVRDFKSLAKEAGESLSKHKALELEIERLLRAIVSQDIMSVVQNNSIEDTSNLQTELEPKFVRDFKSLAKEADESLSKHKALELEIERLLRAIASQDIMSVVQNNSVEDTSNLQTELERTKEHFENCIIKKENEYAKLWNDWYKKCEECKYDKISYDKAYNDKQQKIERLQAQLGDLKGKSKDTSEVKLCGPICFRWMYPFERCMKVIKGHVRNRNRLEGCIAEETITEETIVFLSEYHKSMETVGIPPDKHETDENKEGKLLLAGKSSEVSTELFQKAHLYVIHNTDERVSDVK